MRNFQCTNDDCGKQKLDKYKWDDDLTPEKCECGEDMFEIPRNQTNEATKFLKFSSMSAEDKKKMLTKRSHDHFEREIKERKHEMQRDMLRAMTGKNQYGQ